MLLVIGIIVLVIAVIVAIVIAFANGMADAPGSKISLWPAGAIAIVGLLCLLGHWLLHGKGVTW